MNARPAIVGLVLLSAMVAPGSSIGADSGAGLASGTFDGSKVRWQSLEFEARKLFATATTRVELASGGEAEYRGELRELPGFVHHRTPAELQRVTVKTQVLGRRSVEEVWFEAAGGQAHQRFKERLGRKGYDKIFRFGDAGVALRRRAPASGAEASGPRTGWTKIEERVFDAPAGPACRTVADPAQLFYLLSAHPWENGGFRVCIFSKKAYSLLDVRPVGRQTLTPDTVLDGAAPFADSGVEVIKVSVRPSLLEGQESARFELMGLEGDLEVFLDAELGLPVRIEGRLKSAGDVTVHLKNAALR